MVGLYGNSEKVVLPLTSLGSYGFPLCTFVMVSHALLMTDIMAYHNMLKFLPQVDTTRVPRMKHDGKAVMLVSSETMAYLNKGKIPQELFRQGLAVKS